jgi:hypothetical protein
MPSNLLHCWLTTYDPIHRGWTRAGIASGLSATSGFAFPRVRGGYNLYRAPAGVPDPVWELAGAADADAIEIRTFPWVRHSPGAEYLYRIVPVGGGGVENWADVTQATVRFSESGQWIGPLPNAPCDLQVLPLRGGQFIVRWSYYSNDQQTAPAGFHLYSTTGSQIEYGSAVAEVPYQRAQIHFEYLTAPWPDGLRVGWAVRAYAPAGHDEQNTIRIFALARAAAPPAHPAVNLTVT